MTISSQKPRACNKNYKYMNMKYKFLFFPLLTLLMVNCARNPLPEVVEGGKTVTITATIPTETRVSYSDYTLKLKWEYYDKILLVGYNGTTYKGSEIFTYSGTDYTFTGTPVPGATTYKAYYPAAAITLDDFGNVQIAADFLKQKQTGNNSTTHIGRKLILCDTITNALNQTFELVSQSSIIKFVLKNIPYTIGNIKKLIWTVQTKPEGNNRSAILDISNVNPGTPSLTAYLAFDPTAMKIAANGMVKITLIGDQPYEWSTTVDNLRTYDAGKRYTATVNNDWTTASKTKFRYTITTKKPNTTYEIWQNSSSSINPANLTIDWGDNSDTTIVQGASLLKTIASHKYAVSDDYTITIYSDQVDHTLIQTPQLTFFNSDTYDRDTLLTAILDPFPNMGKDFSFCFWGCIRLTSVPADLFRNNPLATSFYRCFLSCLQLASIPAELFKDNTRARDFTECFAGCQGLNSIPAELFKYNREAGCFSGCFSFCSGLTNIPENLFKYNTHITDFSTCFWHCTGLTSIPANLFIYNTKASLFYGCFWHCTGLTSIPANLFMYNTKATDFSYCFYNCTGLTAIPGGLFNNNLDASNFSQCFSNCTGLTAIPGGLFNNNFNTINFSQCFSHCTGLTAIPAELFNNNTNAADFSSCFSYCSGLTAIPAELFNSNTNATHFSSCFSYCSGLTAIPAELFNSNTNVVDFFSCFAYCTGLTTLPVGLFSSNTTALGFGSCFDNCTGLTTLPAGLFNSNKQAITFAFCFNECTQLQLRTDIFPDPSTNAGFFVGRTMNFSNCFQNVGTQTTSPGIAPRLWEFTGSSGWTVTNCFTNANVSNYGDIPPSWKGL